MTSPSLGSAMSHGERMPKSFSAWPRRLTIMALALLGCAIATYLALYQWEVLDRVFEPFFGRGSERVLRDSVLARVLPVPDAFLGALGYLAEIILESIGGHERWRKLPWAPMLAGLIAIGLAVVAIGLVMTQAFAVKAWCTLCLCSAGISILVAALAWREAHGAYRHWRQIRRSRADTSTG